MTIVEFAILKLSEQEEIIETDAKFIQTQVIGEHLCDFYRYQEFYVVFYYKCNIDSRINSKCLDDINGLKSFITQLSKYKLQD